MVDDSDDKRGKGDAKDPKTEKAQGRRDVLKSGVVVSGAAVAAALSMPKKWTRPLVETVVVPAYATVSPVAPTPSPTGFVTPSPTPAPSPP